MITTTTITDTDTVIQPRRSRIAVIATMFALLGSTFLGTLAQAIPLDERSRRERRRTPVVIAVEKISPTVVSISTEALNRRRSSPWDSLFQRHDRSSPRYRQASLGSGVIIDPKGYVITNEHVIGQADVRRIHVTLTDGRKLPARLVGRDIDNDIALLEVETKTPLPAATLARSDDLMLGESTIAMGNPFGLTGSVTTGILSATGRSIEFRGREVFTDFLQTSAVINPGNSGGPLLNINAEVIGINVAIHSRGPGIGFAIPVRRVREVVRKLLDPRITKRHDLGFEVKAEREDVGVLIARVDGDGPARQAGLETGDRIVAVNGRPVRDWIDFYTRLETLGASANAYDLRLERNRKPVTARVAPRRAKLTLTDREAFRLVGFQFTNLSAGAREQLEIDQGVRVSGVYRGSSAARIGLRNNDVVISIEGYPIADKSEVLELLAKLKSSRLDSLALRLVRQGELYSGKLSLP